MIEDPLHPTDTELSLEVETGTGALRLDLTRRLAAEALGTAFLIIAVIGSGIMAAQLSPTDVGLQLLENAAATAGALIGLILMFGAVSGAHFNPIVTLTDRLLGTTTTRDTFLYVGAQVVGGCLGAVVANLMFELPAVEISTKDRSSLRCGCPRSLRRSGCCSSSRGASAQGAPGRCRSRWAPGSAELTGSPRRRASRTLLSLSPEPCRTPSPGSPPPRRRCSSSCSSSAPSSRSG